MADDYQPPGSSSADNPYQPGDAAVDIEEPGRDATSDSQFRIAHTPPPSKPKVGRAFENFQVLFDRAMGTVGLSWFLLMVGYFISVFAVALGFGLMGQMGGSDAAALLIIPAALLVLVIVGAFLVYSVGLSAALRQVGFFGDYAVSTVGEAFKLAGSRAGTILAMFATIFAVMVLPTGAIFAAGTIEESMMLVGAVLFIPVVIVGALIVAPMYYIIPVTNRPLGECFSESIRLLKSYPGYILLCFLALIGGGMAVGCVVGVLSLIPFIGFFISLAFNFIMPFVSWVGFVAIFATIEEAEQGFEGGQMNQDNLATAGGGGGFGSADFSSDGGPSLYGGDNQVSGSKGPTSGGPPASGGPPKSGGPPESSGPPSNSGPSLYGGDNQVTGTPPDDDQTDSRDDDEDDPFNQEW